MTFRAKYQDCRRKKILILFCVFVFGGNAEAFNTTGHYDTTAVIVGSKAFDDFAQAAAGRAIAIEEKELILACSQLTDMASEFDAIQTFWNIDFSDKLAWAVPGHYPSSISQEEGKMVVTQQLIHGLTGGDIDSLRAMAINTVDTLLYHWLNEVSPARRGTRACALGMALHLYGDSHAHRRIADVGTAETNTMYNTGYGHFIPGHYPDYVLCGSLVKDDFAKTTCSDVPLVLKNGRVHDWFFMAFQLQLLNDLAARHALHSDRFIADMNNLAHQTWLSAVPQLLDAQPSDAEQRICKGAADQCRDMAVGGLLLRMARDQSQFPTDDLKAFAAENAPIQSAGLVPKEDSCEAILGRLRRVSAGMSRLFDDRNQHICATVWQDFGPVALANMRKCATAAGNGRSCVVADLIWIYQDAGGQSGSQAQQCVASLFPSGSGVTQGSSRCAFKKPSASHVQSH